MTPGLLTLFTVGLLASTLLPMGSEPVLVVYLLTADAPRVIAAVLAIGVGNTLGGVITYAMGRGVRVLWQRWRPQTTERNRATDRATAWLDRYGPFALILSWLPVIGDPLCWVAGSLKLPLWPCVFWIALGKFARYAVVVAVTLAI
jgi:membrane protein YqaA with SNARE-associated domain